MARGNQYLVYSDIYALDKIVQNSGIMFGRNLLIDTLREIFARDREYKFVRDEFGFPKTPDHKGLDANAGLADDATTRLFIGSSYRYDVSYLPGITVRQTSTSYKPISFNSNIWDLEYEFRKTVDGYGTVTYSRVPVSYNYAGAWEQTFEVKVTSKSLDDTINIVDIIMVSLQNTYRNILTNNGLFIKHVRASGEGTETIGSNDPLYVMTVTLETYSEWRRSIPVSNVIERITACFDFDITESDPPANSLVVKVDLT